jgi:uncharacterized protein YmfQ (DUF2313 family)
VRDISDSGIDVDFVSSTVKNVVETSDKKAEALINRTRPKGTTTLILNFKLLLGLPPWLSENTETHISLQIKAYFFIKSFKE